MDITNQLKSSVTIDQVVSRLGLNLPTRSADSMLGNCPTGHASKSGQCFGVNLSENYFNCFNCGTAGDIINLVELVKECDFNTALQWLASEFRPDLKPHLGKQQSETTPQTPQQKEYYQKADFFKQIYEYGKEQLYTPVAKQEMDYLINNRGYDKERLKKSDWIYFPPDQEIKKHLIKLHPEAAAHIRDLKLQGFNGDNFRLAFPYRDRFGRITAFIKRSISPAGITVTRGEKTIEGIRYDSTPGSGAKHDLFNLCNCKKQNTLLIVEGYPDALYFRTLGMDNVVAVGQGLLSKSHLEGLEEFGVKNVIIAFDNDLPKIDQKTGKEIITGVENTDKALKLLASTKIKSFVLVPAWLAPHKDPDEFVKANSIDDFKTLTNNAISGAKWLATRLLEQHDTSTDLGKETAMQEAFKASLEFGQIDREQYIGIIEEKLNLTHEYVEKQIEELHKKNENDRLLKGYQNFFNTGVEYSQAGKLQEMQNLFEKRSNLERKSLYSAVGTYSMDDFLLDINTSPEGLKTGFESLDKKLIIPNDAMTIVAGRPSHGKTTLMLNICLNMVERYPEKTFLFFTYEEPKKHLALKFLNILADHIIDESNNQKMLTRYLRGGHTDRGQIEKARSKLNDYLSQGRLWIVDERKTAHELQETLEQFSQEHNIGAVFIDYIQKIPSGDKFGSRQLELQSTSGQILEIATSIHIPVILGAQLNRVTNLKEPSRIRLENLREAGDIEQDANLVIGIYNEAMEKLRENGDMDTGDTVPLSIQILKNRNGIPMVNEYLQFQRSTLVIRDHSFADILPARLAA